MNFIHQKVSEKKLYLAWMDTSVEQNLLRLQEALGSIPRTEGKGKCIPHNTLHWDTFLKPRVQYLPVLAKLQIDFYTLRTAAPSYRMPAHFSCGNTELF